MREAVCVALARLIDIDGYNGDRNGRRAADGAIYGGDEEEPLGPIGNPALAEEVGNAGAITPLVNEVTKGTDKARVSAACLLLALYTGTARGRKEQIATRIVEPIAMMLRQEQPEPVRAAAALCVGRMYDTDVLRSTFVVGFKSRSDLKRMRRETRHTEINASGALASLAGRHRAQSADTEDGEDEAQDEPESARKQRWTQMVDCAADIEVQRQHDVLKDLFEDAMNPYYFPRFTVAASNGGHKSRADNEAEEVAVKAAARASIHERALRALLNLCHSPEVNRYVRDRHESRCDRLVKTFIAEARRRVTGELMAEILMILSYTEAVEQNLAVMEETARSKIKKQVIDKRKERDYEVLDDIASQFTEEEIEHYKRSFRELDVDDSGSVDTDELSVLFKQLKMKLSRRDIRTIINEVDVDGSGEIEVGVRSAMSCTQTHQTCIH